MKNSIFNKIKKEIAKSKYKNAFTVFDFQNIGNYDNVRKSIARLEKQGYIKRIIRGYYYKPIYSKIFKIWSNADIDDVVHAIARTRKWKICVNRNRALNSIGLSTQIPNIYTYASTGPNKTIKINNITVKFIRCADKDFTNNDLTNIFIQSLKFLGKDNVDLNTIKTIKSRLTHQQIQDIKNCYTQTSQWIKKYISIL